MFNPADILIRDNARFSVIYSIDCPKDDNISWRVNELLPPKNQRKLKLWDVTEQGESEYSSAFESPWMHWKFCAVLNWEQFKEFVMHCEVYSDICSTMGSIGCPGFGFSWCPAVAINGDRQDAIQIAYVTPWIENCDYRCSWESMENWFKNLWEQYDLDDSDDDTLATISGNWVHYQQQELFTDANE